MMKIIKNNLYLFREICHADPWRIPYSFFNAVFCGVFQVFFYVYIIKYIINNIFLFQNFEEIVKNHFSRNCNLYIIYCNFFSL